MWQLHVSTKRRQDHKTAVSFMMQWFFFFFLFSHARQLSILALWIFSWQWRCYTGFVLYSIAFLNFCYVLLPLYVTSKIKQQRKVLERSITLWWERTLVFVRLKLPLLWLVPSSRLPAIVWGCFGPWSSALVWQHHDFGNSDRLRASSLLWWEPEQGRPLWPSSVFIHLLF